MEPPAAKKPKKLAAGLAAGARKPAAASNSSAASLASSAHKPKAKPQKVRGDLAVVVAARAVQQHLEKFQRPFTAAQLWENTQKVVAKKEIVAACARLAQEGDIAVKEFQSGKVLLYYAEPDAMARKHGAFATPEALCDVCFDVLPCVEILRLLDGVAVSVPHRSTTQVLPETIGDAAQTDAQAAKLEKRAKLLRAEPTNEELDALLREAEAASSQEHRVDDATLAARVTVLSSGTFVTPEELRAAQEKHDAYLAKWKRLRRVVMDACARVGESCEDVDLAHLAGVFTDAEAGVLAVPEALVKAAQSSSSSAPTAPVVTKKKLGIRKRARA